MNANHHDDSICFSRYSKSKVYLHPSSYLRDNLPGFLSIVQVGKSKDYLLAWIPEAAVEGTDDYDAYVLVEVEGKSNASKSDNQSS